MPVDKNLKNDMRLDENNFCKGEMIQDKIGTKKALCLKYAFVPDTLKTFNIMSKTFSLPFVCIRKSWQSSITLKSNQIFYGN